MGQQAIVGSIQGKVNRTLLKSHTQKKSKRAHLLSWGSMGGAHRCKNADAMS